MSKDIEALQKRKGGIRLDIGAGQNRQPGFVGMDIQDFKGYTDVVWDWNVHPWPFPDESVIQAMASHVVEHIPTVAIDNGRTRLPFIEFMDEVWRILKFDAEFLLVYPHGRSEGYLQDPTHCHAMNETTMAYFDPLEDRTGGMLYKFYRPKPWRIKFITWSPDANVEVVLEKRREDKSYYV